MGAEQSTLTKNGYKLQRETRHAVIVTKNDETFLIKKIILDQTSRSDAELTSEIENLKATRHPHIAGCKDSLKDRSFHYVVMEFCTGGSLAEKIREMTQPPQESEVLSWIVEICVALRTIHEKNLLHKHLMPEKIFFNESGIVCLGGFGKIHERSKKTQSTNNLAETINYLAPEVFTTGTYDAKSDIWSVGCILYELCTLQQAFSAETTIKIMPKVIGGPYPPLPEQFSPDLCQLLKDIFNKDPESRPTASEILARPFIIGCLSEKCKDTVEDLQKKLSNLRTVADGLERVHQGATIGSLAGGVTGAVGGITSIVGLILTPFTLGASLIVTGVGVGVGALGAVTAAASNITNMVNQSSDRKAIRSSIREFEQKINAVVTWLQEISDGFQTMRRLCGSPGTEESESSQNNFARLGLRAGRGLAGTAELIRLVQVMNIGRIAAQSARVVRVAEIATGVFSGLFVAVDIFFIAMDAKEIHHIKQAKAAQEGGATRSESVSETDTSQAQDQSSQNTTPIRSEIMKFVQSIRQAADDLQKVLDELEQSISSIPRLGVNEQGWINMELM